MFCDAFIVYEWALSNEIEITFRIRQLLFLQNPIVGRIQITPFLQIRCTNVIVLTLGKSVLTNECQSFSRWILLHSGITRLHRLLQASGGFWKFRNIFDDLCRISMSGTCGSCCRCKHQLLIRNFDADIMNFSLLRFCAWGFKWFTRTPSLGVRHRKFFESFKPTQPNFVALKETVSFPVALFPCCCEFECEKANFLLKFCSINCFALELVNNVLTQRCCRTIGNELFSQFMEGDFKTWWKI